jgi:hypothetical protein
VGRICPGTIFVEAGRLSISISLCCILSIKISKGKPDVYQLIDSGKSKFFLVAYRDLLLHALDQRKDWTVQPDVFCPRQEIHVGSACVLISFRVQVLTKARVKGLILLEIVGSRSRMM